jgi:hypothetical protein
MNTTLRSLPRAASRCLRRTHPQTRHSQIRPFSHTPRIYDPSSTRPPPPPPDAEAAALSRDDASPAPTYLGTIKRLPEFNLVDKVVLVSGAARGLGLVQAEALLEAGATGTHCTSHLQFPALKRNYKSKILGILRIRCFQSAGKAANMVLFP